MPEPTLGPPTFDVTAWRARYAAAWHAAAAARPDADAEAMEALLAPLRALLEEWVLAHPDRGYRQAHDPNVPPLWPPEVTRALLFVRCDKAVACALCGRRRRRLWTMTQPFRAADPVGYVVNLGAEVYYPLTPVCDSHPLAPARLPEQAEAAVAEAKGGNEC